MIKKTKKPIEQIKTINGRKVKAKKNANKQKYYKKQTEERKNCDKNTKKKLNKYLPKKYILYFAPSDCFCLFYITYYIYKNSHQQKALLI